MYKSSTRNREGLNQQPGFSLHPSQESLEAGPASRLCGWSPSATLKTKMKIKKKPNNVASPRLDHRLPGAVTVFLFVSRRTILLSANEDLERGQGVSLREGAERSRAPEGELGSLLLQLWRSRQWDNQQQTWL